MKQIKRFLSGLLVLCLVASMIPVTARAATSGTCGDNLTWTLSDDGVLTISGIGDMYYSEQLNSRRSLIKHAVIEEGVTAIGDSAFEYFGNLTSVTIPNSVTEIGVGAFDYCKSLANITIPDSVTKININAFRNCSSLTNVTISKNVTLINSFAFYGCSSLSKVIVPASVSYIGGSAFSQCTNLNTVIFCGDAPEFAESEFSDLPYTFVGVSATAYYPANNPTWTSDVLKDYGGDINWVSYNPGETPGGGSGGTTEPEVESHDTLAELTEVDYMAFSAVAYQDFDGKEKMTLKAVLQEKGLWDKTYGKTDIKYSELCAGIAEWKVHNVSNYSDINGFYATTFRSGSDAVIAYRGSVPLGGLGDLGSTDAIYDWIYTDLPAELWNTVYNTGQYELALGLYEYMSKDFEVAVTGHSLGGGLADIVSAVYGCKGVTMNAISILDAIYAHDPKLFSKSYTGIDQWNFVDHANASDLLAGSFENVFTTKVKPVVAHASNTALDTSSVPKLLGTAAACHGLDSYLTRDSEGNPTLQAKVYSAIPIGMISSTMLAKNQTIDFGTKKTDLLNIGLSVLTSRVVYGGNGSDNIQTNIRGDIIIGGKGDDSLDGGRGNDTYYYYNGDGIDTIHDIGGNDTLYLLGFDVDDSFSVYEPELDSDYIEVRSGDNLLVKISKKNREYSLKSLDSFRIVIDYEIDGVNPKVYDITDAFDKQIYGEHLFIGCPVDVEVLDASGNVVFTLKDSEVGTHYTSYGNFYVFEEENGEYGKVLDLFEGYTARIIGVDEGTMDITYQVSVDGELTVPVSVTDVPVSNSTVANIETAEDGEVNLIIDETGDGNTEETVTLAHIHEWDGGKTTTAADCISSGKKLYTCISCGDTKTEIIAAWGHNYEDSVCSTCGHTIITAPVAKGSNNESTGKPMVTWEPVEGAVKYEVYRATKKTGSYSRKSTTTGTSYTNTGAVAGKYYYYFVRAIDADGNYADSNIVGRTCDLAQATVTLSNVASTGKIKISWKAVEGATKYEVYRATSKNGTYSRISTTSNTSVTNTKAEAGKTYYYKVRAICDVDAAAGAYSSVKYRTCDLAQTTVTLSNVASTGKVKISWTAVEGATKYEVYRATSKDGTYSRISTTSNTSVTNTKAEAGKTYYYKVRAICNVDAAAAAYSAIKSRTCDLAQTTVTLSNVASTGKVKISWEAVEGATKYEVYRATSKNGTYSRISTTSNTSVTNTKAGAGKTYYYKVRAICDVDAAAAAYSAVKSRTCDLPQPDVSIALSSKKPKVSWGKVSGAVEYQVYRATSKSGTYSLVKTTTASYYKDSKATSGKTYYYKVVAVCSNTAGNSAYSSIVSIKSK